MLIYPEDCRIFRIYAWGPPAEHVSFRDFHEGCFASGEENRVCVVEIFDVTEKDVDQIRFFGCNGRDATLGSVVITVFRKYSFLGLFTGERFEAVLQVICCSPEPLGIFWISA